MPLVLIVKSIIIMNTNKLLIKSNNIIYNRTF